MKKYLAFILCLLMLFLCACGGGSGTAAGTDDPGKQSDPPSSGNPVESDPGQSDPVQSEDPKESTTPDPSPSPSGEPAVKDSVNPLTGLPMSAEQAKARPVAVVINNLRQALPQQGISKADIIYEVETEGGITRMVALFQSLEGVETLASIRSARTAFLEFALGHDAIFVHAGGSEDAYTYLSQWKVDNMDGVRGKFSQADNGLFWRDRERVDGHYYDLEHSLVTTGDAIRYQLKKSSFRLDHAEGYSNGLIFSENGTPAGGETANNIAVLFSSYKTGMFRYDSAKGVYLVEQYSEPHVDGNDGKQLAVTNVIVLTTPIKSNGSSGGYMDVELNGGNGWFACGGKIVPITWEKGGQNEPFRYYTADGADLVLGQGTTYVNIISDKMGIGYE